MSDNYEKRFQELVATLTTDAEKEKFCNDPLSYLADFEIPIVNSFDLSANELAIDLSNPAELGEFFQRATGRTSPLTGRKCTASWPWWGLEITMNEELTRDVIDGVLDAGAIGEIVTAALGTLGIITGPIAVAIGVPLALIFMAKVWQIKLVDKGNGVKWKITWAQWALLIAAIPGGVSTIVAAGMLFLHPQKN